MQQNLVFRNLFVKGFTPLCLTWAVFDSDRLITYLRSGFHQRYEPTRWKGEIERVGMNLIVIEEHQVEDLVFAQVRYLYTLLEATLAYVIVPITKVPRTKYSSYQYYNHKEAWGTSADPGCIINTIVCPSIVHSPSWDTGYHVSGCPRT